jgi:hypothetical protein
MTGRPPDFICIGAMKAGTSWLCYNLAQHPGVHIPFKEPNFFNPAQPCIHFPDAPKTQDWYLSLFEPAGERLCGDISPSYAWIPNEAISLARRIAPKATVLYILRNPVERYWSMLRMRNAIDGLPLHKEIPPSHGRDHSNYMHHLRRWQTAFGHQVHVLFYEKLCESPAEFYTEACTLLGLDPSAHPDPKILSDIVFQGPEIPMPRELRRAATVSLLATIHACYATFPNRYTERWVAEADVLLGL